MAQDLSLHYSTAGLATIYAVLRSGSNYVNASTGALIAATSANWSAASISLSDTASANEYVANIPDGTPAGSYSFNIYKRIPSAPDSLIASSGQFDWDGTTIISLRSISSSGSGAFRVIVHVTDGTSPLPNATVRFSPTIFAQTDGSGNASFSIDAGTYTLTITYAGYSYTPTTRVITAGITLTEAMTLTTSLPATNPTQCNVYVTCLDTKGAVRPNAIVEYQVTSTGSSPGLAFSGHWERAVANSLGVAVCVMAQGINYRLRLDAGKPVNYLVPSSGAATLSVELLGGW